MATHEEDGLLNESLFVYGELELCG
jgi:hypothetical protein